MRKFIISDIHGFGNLYYSVMAYLDNISKNEDIELYINGDLIDRGFESAEILLDIKKRIKENKYKIVYLGGNHELLMYKFFKDYEKNHLNYFNDWYHNGGYITDDGLHEILDTDDKINEVVNFVSNLNIYHKFKEKINNKPIVLVHSACPHVVDDICNMKIKDDDDKVFKAVWTREYFILDFLDFFKNEKRPNRIGNDNYFTIIGHTPVDDKYGVKYYKNYECLNIDGGVAMHVSGNFKYNHFPLIEVCDNYLKILTFNSENEITYGNYFDGNKFTSYNNNELNESREYIDKSIKTKKLSINEDGLVGYWK